MSFCCRCSAARCSRCSSPGGNSGSLSGSPQLDNDDIPCFWKRELSIRIETTIRLYMDASIWLSALMYSVHIYVPLDIVLFVECKWGGSALFDRTHISSIYTTWISIYYVIIWFSYGYIFFLQATILHDKRGPINSCYVQKQHKISDNIFQIVH